MGEPRRLLQQPVDPLATQIAHPSRRAADAAGLEIKQGADGEEQICLGLVSMLVNPKLLQGIAHTYENAVGAGVTDIAASLLDVLRSQEETIPVPHDRVAWIRAAERLGRTLDDGIGRPHEIDAEIMLGPLKVLRHEVGAVKILRKEFTKYYAARYIGAKAVVEYEEPAQGRAKVIVIARHVQRLRIGEANVSAAPMRQSLIDRSDGLVAAEVANGHAKNRAVVCRLDGLGILHKRLHHRK